MKILLSAYACEPDRGSEQEVGWNWALQAARGNDVWVITRATNEQTIREYSRKREVPTINWVYFDLPPLLRFWKRRRRGLHLYYYLWQVGAYFKARRLHREVRFDVVNHVTFVTYWMPSFMSLLGAPFIWGPVGGGESAPPNFYRTFSVRGRALELFRDVARIMAQLDPFVRATARRARIVLASTDETARAVRRLGAARVAVLSQVALSSEEEQQLAALPLRTHAPFRMVSVGSLLHLKGFHLSLAAFARHAATNSDSEYWIIGEGPERVRLERQAERLRVTHRVRFLGSLARPIVFETLRECDVLVHPTLHDSGGFVCLEAMAAGRPVICLDLGGPGLLVTPEAGIKVQAGEPDQVVADVAAAMTQLANDVSRRRQLGECGRRRVQETFSWRQKGRIIQKLYEQYATS